MNPKKKIGNLIQKADVATGSETDKRILYDALEHLGQLKQRSWPKSGLGGWQTFVNSSITKLGIAAVIVIAAIVCLHQINAPGIAWADVAETFRSVSFFNATFYIKDEATAQPEQIELWMNKTGRIRLRMRDQVIFGLKGQTTSAFDLKTKSETAPDPRAASLIATIGSNESFSLETVIRSFSGGKLMDVTPLVNTGAVISEDLAVFDVESENSRQWCRIWALRTSRLPVQIRLWDPRDGQCADIFLTYAEEQQKEFFDPEAFSSRMKSLHGKDINLAYMFLTDPGGRQIFPSSLNEPEVFQVVTTTLDGRPWSLAEHRGKAVLMHFWDARRQRQEQWLKSIYERFKDREDFLLVGVSLVKDAESTRRICNERNMPWLQLHEPGRQFNNTLARAFGVDDTYDAIWLIWKNARIDRLDLDLEMDTGRIEGAVLGLTYDSEIWIHQILFNAKKEGALNCQTAEQICGKPQSVTELDKGQRWQYDLYNQAGTAVRTFHIDFDEAGNCVNWGSGHRILHPAVVTVSFSRQYMEEHIESQMEPQMRTRLYEEHLVSVGALSGNREYPLSGQTSIRPEESYTRELFPGLYSFAIRIWASSKERKTIKMITLLENVELGKDEKKTIRFE